MYDKDVDIPKTLVIGSSGFIGSHFLKYYRDIYPDMVGLDVNPMGGHSIRFDISSMSIKEIGINIRDYRNALVLAGITKVSVCEKEKERSRKINVDGTVRLIRELIEKGIKPIFFSSDYVFDGEKGGYRDDDPVNPINEYGKQKAEVEALIPEITDGNFLVVRLGKVFSLKKKDGTLFDEMADILSSGGVVRAAHDQIFCPISINDVIKAVTELQKKDASGIYNVCSIKPFSRYALACGLARALKKDESQIKPVSIDTIDPAVKRPKNTSMIPDKLKIETGIFFDNIHESIEKIADNWR